MSHRRVALSHPGAWSAVLMAVALLGGSSGCAKLNEYRGTGFKESENWGGELRETRQSTGEGLSGVSTKANQIEKNLGVR